MVTSCASVPVGDTQQDKGSVIGAIGGAAIGAAVGAYNNGLEGALTGATIGGVAGYLAGSMIGKYYDERAKKLAKVESDSGVKIQTSAYDLLSSKDKNDFEAKTKSLDEKSKMNAYKQQTAFKAVVPAQFDTGSAKLSPKMQTFFADIAKAYKSDGVRKVLIVGHADSRGDSAMNQRLSEQRAKAVAKIFMNEGYPASGIYYQGAGESEPVADNSTEDGRAKNRRVELVDASSSHDLALVKRFSIDESKREMEKVKAVAENRETIHEEPVRSLYGSDSIIPFDGELYTGQMLMSSGHKAVAAEQKGGTFGSVLSALGKMGSPVVTAHAADEHSIPAFMDDQMVMVGDIKRLDNQADEIFTPQDYMPGYYNQPVYTYLRDDAFLSLQPVAILKEEALSNHRPKMIVYKRFDAKDDKADANLQGVSQLYISGDQLLYRWKSNADDAITSGILGMDVLLPKFEEMSFQKTHSEHLDAQVYYIQGGKVMVEKMKLDLKLNKDEKIEWGV